MRRRGQAAVLAGLVLMIAAPPALAQVPAVAPEQPHVTLAENGLVVHFALADGPADAGAPQLVYSVDGGPEQTVAATRVGTVVPTVPADGIATQVWAAEVAVPPGGRLTYRAAHTAFGTGAEHTVSRPGDGPLHLVAMGDIGYDGVGADGSGDPAASPPIAMRDLALAQDPGLLVIPGDLAYLNSRAGWDRFFRMHAPLQATVAVLPAAGNHEWEDGVGYGQYLASYVLPEDELDYVQRVGPATFVVVNSDGTCTGVHHRSGGPLHKPCPDGPDESRMAWLRGALAAAKEDAAPWTIVVMHHPPYSWGRHGSDWPTHVYWAPLFEEFGVDLVLTAHDHLYGRTHQVVQREVRGDASPYQQGAGPLYAVLGGGGRELYDLPPGDAPDWLAHGEKVHHLAVLDIDEATLTYRAVRIDGTEMDAFVLHAAAGAHPGGDLEAAPTLGAWGLLALLAGAVALARRRRA